jgi:threonine dehydratase
LAITPADVIAAQERIAGGVHRTPVMTSQLLDEVAGRQLYFKCENLQRGGSFKVRGATNKLRQLSDDARQRGVVAYSSGNHAQGVALAARDLGVSAVIVMAADAPSAKVNATRGYGADIVTYDRRTDDREAIAAEIMERDGRVLVPPYDDLSIIAGQGTATLELLQDVADLDAIVAPVGGGGLLAGAAVAGAAEDPPVRAFGAEPETADDTARSLEAGERVGIAPPETIADGARVQIPGELTFPIVRELAADVVRVPEAAIVRAMTLVMTRMKLVVEPTAALAAAAALEGLLPSDVQRVGVILSGGNLDLQLLGQLVG